MQKNTKGRRTCIYTQNRELSWLRFNRRVLEEAADASVPLLERMRYISIFSSNLDEFFMVRAGSLFDISHVSPNEEDNKTGMTAGEQLEKIYAEIPELIRIKENIFSDVCHELGKRGFADLGYEDLKSSERRYVNGYYKASILPIISPMIIGSHHPVPHLVNKSLYISAYLKDKKGRASTGFIPVPAALPHMISMPGSARRFIRIENIILHWAETLFGSYSVESSCVISVTRNADISFDEEKFEDNEEGFRNQMLKLLKKRDSLAVIRMEVNRRVSENFLDSLLRMVRIGKHQVFYDDCPLNMGYLDELISEIKQEEPGLFFRHYGSRWPEDIQKDRGIIEQIKKKDRLLFFPFDSVDPFLHLLNEAAGRDDVLSIKITIYRLASSSRIAQMLCRAAENGKEVIVLMELRARFDEANNISWSKMLEEAGCQVVYGIEDFKCHSKICLITLKSRGSLSYITQIGTGNYNEKTNTMYTDLSMITASRDIGADAAMFFRNMLINNLKGEYDHLLVAPDGIRSALGSLIDSEISKGHDGYICIKANSITERSVIDKLAEASEAGVTVHLIIRGICCILPQIKSYTDNIDVTSIVGRYLEHARIYCFGRGNDAKLYISSADLMTRNLTRRVEIACPIYDSEIKRQLIWILDMQLEDNVKASYMMNDGSYMRKDAGNHILVNSQEKFMEQSFHTECVPEGEKEGGLLELAGKLKAFFHRGNRQKDIMR